jgi:hypothetical protein
MAAVAHRIDRPSDDVAHNSRVRRSLRRHGSLALALGFLLTALAARTSAHHSPVAFDTGVTDFMLAGEIERVEVRNPHSVMDLRVANTDGTATVWHIEFSSVNLLLRRGWDFERLKVGEQVTCIGNPSASGRPEMYMWSIMLADGTEFGR